uniref:Serpin domain-containing protein n=1 Tax=Glossina austeni TaxID=7395 RepID=A0A1A9V395_GLOAU
MNNKKFAIKQNSREESFNKTSCISDQAQPIFGNWTNPKLGMTPLDESPNIKYLKRFQETHHEKNQMSLQSNPLAIAAIIVYAGVASSSSGAEAYAASDIKLNLMSIKNTINANN